RDDVIARCRLLRNIPRAKAEKLVNAMGSALQEWFVRINPQAVLCHMVDEYVTHLTSIIARKRGIAYVGYAGSFFPGRIQLTQFGNGVAFDVREPDDVEIDSTIATILQPRFRQDYAQKLAYSRGRHAKLTARYYVKRLAFWLKGLAENDPQNVHYIITPHIVERRRISDFPDFSDFHEDWRTRAEAAGKPAVYLPLGYFPESTIDYWVPDRRILAYEQMTLEMARVLARDFTVLVKEHPHMLGARPPAFYAALAATDGVLNLPPLAFSEEAMAVAAASVLGAGSGGVEAALRGKPLFSYCATSYWFAASGAAFLDLARLEDWLGQIRAGIDVFQPLSPAARRALIAQCLRSTVRKRGQGARWPLIHLDDLRATLHTATALRTPASVAHALQTDPLTEPS
ncbi:MAG: hypothetical protein ACRCXM_08795, partial [Beijerinckiaceae bacterium]